jgi:UDP-N-acetylglucosamine--N-acetylmuramyl-(pentapeptide) pyrophosphoryl-undecaprenol N-acetylglucosamine transferase
MRKILLVGGGTGGSITPLLAMRSEIKKKEPETEFLFIGPKNDDVAEELVRKEGISYQSIYAGKWRRYFSLKNLISPFLTIFGFFQSLKIIKNFKPDMVLSAGSFTSVPVGIAAWFLRVPLFIHQQDIIPSLTNRLLTPFAYKITVSLPPSLKDFPAKKTILTGNPVRQELLNASEEEAKKFFSLKPNLPVILVLGGGKGAAFINQLIFDLLPELTSFSQVIHLTGKGKSRVFQNENYHQFEFLDKEMSLAYKVADIVICRAGMGTLSELSFLGKPAIVLPIPHTHQEANAYYFLEKKAVRALFREEQTKENLLKEIRHLLKGDSPLFPTSANPHQ